MKERLKLKGVVTARNSETGEVIFENLHNTIVLGGCISALAKIAGVDNSGDIFIADGITPPSNYKEALEKPITHYNFTFRSGSNDTNIEPVDKELNADIASEADHVFMENKEVSFFDGEEQYSVADIPEGAEAAHILALKEGCLSFIRYKLNLKKAEIDNPGQGDITYVDSVELYSTVGEGAEAKTMLFSKLNFPAIPFFGSLSIDFEYRIYL